MLHIHKTNLLTFLFYYNYSHKNNKSYMKNERIYSLIVSYLSQPNFQFLNE
jgi:hypothetical protein